MSDKEHQNKKTQQAYALEYQDSRELPKVLASGIGGLADEIVRIAESLDIPVEHSPEAAEALRGALPGVSIPEESFDLIAEVVAFLYYCDEKWREKHGFLKSVLGDESAVPSSSIEPSA